MNMSDTWQIFNVNELKQQRADEDVSFHEFLSVDSMHCGLYHLKAGSKDMQTPHDEDEMYYVVEGKAKLRIGDAEQNVVPGTLLYIRATEEHAFFEIEEDMTLLVIFA